MPIRSLILVIFFALFIEPSRLAAQSNSTFINVPVDLVNNEVTSVIQDKNGFLWFGTRGGLQWYDGYDMKLLKNDVVKGANLLSQSIEVLLPGKQNDIWIGTKSGGLSNYDFKTGRLVNYKNDRSSAGTFNADYILSLYEEGKDRLFVGTWKGFQYLNKQTNQFTIINNDWRTFDIQPDGQNGFWIGTDDGLKHLNSQLVNDRSYDFGKPNINIASITVDTKRNCLWLGTWQQGLIRFDLNNQRYKQYLHKKENTYSISSNNTYRVYLDSKDNLWVGTWGAGLNQFNPTTEQFERVQLNVPGLLTSDNQIILTISEDASGLLWVGTDGSGIFKKDLNQKRFYNIGYILGNSGFFQRSTHVLSVYKDSYQKLWLGIRGDGIKYQHQSKRFSTLNLPKPEKDVSPGSPYESRAFLEDGAYLWFATNKGLLRAKNGSDHVTDIQLYQPDDGEGAISGRKINVLTKDADGRIWIGMQEHGISKVIAYNRQGRPVFKNYLPAYGVEGALQNERVSAILVDSKKRIWVGTYKGLHLYQPQTDNFRFFPQTDDGKSSLSNNTVLCLAEDNQGNIWAGTQYGLNKITVGAGNTLSVRSFTKKNGLPSDYIHGVFADKRGNIWMSTNKGICRLNAKNFSLVVFDKRDGVQSVSFSENAVFKADNGYVYFGGAEGATYFNPDSIDINLFQPPLFFTSIKVNNVQYQADEKQVDSAVIEKPIYETKEITLDHTQNIFSVSFAALDYHAPDKNEYMYQLVGFNDDWVPAGNNRSLTFTNLNPGTYHLRLKATNSDKIWGTQVHELTIHILSPPWKSWWAYTIYVALFIFLLWLTRYLGLRQEALKNQLVLSTMERDREHQLAEFKERLFTNISHEFRTPLTLILGPLDDLLQRIQLDAPVEKSLRLIQKQSRRMLRMVNQLLDFQKAQSGSLKLSPQPGELVSFCYNIFLLFSDEAKRRSIDYRFEHEDKYLSFMFDHNKLEIIIFNILSNAFKFTHNHQSIVLSIRKGEHGICVIQVKDTGKGIPLADQDKIFDRFYRGKEEDATTISGTGIGLSFVKELVELHQGSIRVESDGYSGSIFTIVLPGKSAQAKELVLGTELLLPTLPIVELSLNANDMPFENESQQQENELPIILVIEDEPDMLDYIVEILSASFQVVTATNGREGLEKALEYIPDLIVSDVMMPEINGIELCKKLKSDKGTSHIPIILLTALNDLHHHVQGIQEGADVYMPKPFHSQLLLVHIHNLINSRNTLKELYAKKIFLGSSNFEIKSFEEEFLYKLVKLVEENISNSNFSNDELAALMYMSRSTFYRKLKAVTGMSGNEFIRTTRLNYAAKLLESGNYSVTDAAFEAGFNDIKYFRKRFQDQFGVSPSEYKR